MFKISGARNTRLSFLTELAILCLLAACTLTIASQSAAAPSVVPAFPSAATGLPSPDHVIIVMEENHGYSEIIGNAQAPYINALAAQGALFTNSHAIEHPSQPNYLDLFSGSNQGITDDSCPHTFTGIPNLGTELITASLTFTGYSEDLPGPGSTVCSSGEYYRKHNPWVNFTNVPSAGNLPFTYFPSDYSTLPTLSFVIPNQLHDMHDGTIAQGDTWLNQNLDAYKQWAMAHNSLLVVTWDEDDYSQSNQIATIFAGPMVVPGQYSEQINHFNVLRTLEDMYGLPYAGVSGQYQPISDVWTGGATPTLAPTTSPTRTLTDSPTRTTTPIPTGTATATAMATAIPPTATYTEATSATPTQPIATNTYSPTATMPPATGTPTIVSTDTEASMDTATSTVVTATTAPATTTATPTHSACIVSFRDVPSGSTFFPFVRCLACLGIIGGYPDGTFHPNNNVTRGQLSKIVSNAAGFDDPVSAQLFEDVPAGSPFYDYVYRLASRNIIGGYPCGLPGEPCMPGNLPYFRPINYATRGQISKIVANAARLNDPPGNRLFEDVTPGSTYFDFVQRLANRGAMSGYPCGGPGEPCGPGRLPYFRPGNNASRGQTSKITTGIFFPDCNPQNGE